MRTIPASEVISEIDELTGRKAEVLRKMQQDGQLNDFARQQTEQVTTRFEPIRGALVEYQQTPAEMPLLTIRAHNRRNLGQLANGLAAHLDEAQENAHKILKTPQAGMDPTDLIVSAISAIRDPEQDPRMVTALNGISATAGYLYDAARVVHIVDQFREQEMAKVASPAR